MPDRLYTLAEASEILRLSTRGVAKIARRHGLCLVQGRQIFLEGKDIEAIKGVMRVEPKVPMRVKVEPSLSPYQVSERARAFFNQKKKKPGRLRWEATHAANKEEREATLAALKKLEGQAPIDRKNRDPEYWTDDRKERLRLERLAAVKGWVARK